MVVLTVMSNLCFENGFCTNINVVLCVCSGEGNNARVNFLGRMSRTVQHEGLVLSAGQSVVVCLLVATSALSCVPRGALCGWAGSRCL